MTIEVREIRIKDTVAVLDFFFDWKPLTNGVEGAESDWLEETETIVNFSLAVSDADLTIDSSSQADGRVTFWLSGGENKTLYTVSCTIETSGSRTDRRSMGIYCKYR